MLKPGKLQTFLLKSLTVFHHPVLDHEYISTGAVSNTCQLFVYCNSIFSLLIVSGFSEGSVFYMATLSVTSTKESTNYARFCRLLIDVGTQALKDTFDGFYTPGNLDVFLGSLPVQSNLKSLRKRNLLNTEQWTKLYPAIPKTVSSASFDITLLSVLLRNVCGLSPPASTASWDKLPPTTDTSLEADLVRIKYYRNTFYGHVEKASIDDVTFHGLWHDIESAMVRLGGPTYAAAIAKLKVECMDPDIEEHYTEALLMLKKDEDSVKNKIDQLDKKLDDFMKSSDEERVKDFLNMSVDKETMMMMKGIMTILNSSDQFNRKKMLKVMPMIMIFMMDADDEVEEKDEDEDDDYEDYEDYEDHEDFEDYEDYRDYDDHEDYEDRVFYRYNSRCLDDDDDDDDDQWY